MLSGECHRGQAFIHWLVANAAGGGVLGGFFELVAMNVKSGALPHDSASPMWFVLVILGSVAVLYSQQLVLRAGGIPSPFWIVASIAGVLLGGMAGTSMFLFVILAAALSNSDALAIIAIVLSVFTSGAVVGLLQTAGYDRPWRGRLPWVVVNGIVMFPLLFINELAAAPLLGFNPSTYGTILGGIYGLITGGCLVWLLPKTRDEGVAMEW